MGHDFEEISALYTRAWALILLQKAAALPEIWYVSQQTIKGQNSQDAPGG
jgi:hypothetical protein